MPVFQYVGMNDKGRRVSGRMSAMDEAGLEQKLRTLGLYLVEAKPTKETQKSANGPVSGTRLPMALWRAKKRRRLLIESCTLLGFQLKVGIPLVQALEVASTDCDNPEFQRILVGVRQHLEAGEFFHEALGRYPGMFPLEFRCVVKAGEQSGQLPDGLEYMRGYLEWFDQLMAEIQQASLYPGIVMVVVGNQLPVTLSLSSSMEEIWAASTLMRGYLLDDKTPDPKKNTRYHIERLPAEAIKTALDRLLWLDTRLHPKTRDLKNAMYDFIQSLDYLRRQSGADVTTYTGYLGKRDKVVDELVKLGMDRKALEELMH